MKKTKSVQKIMAGTLAVTMLAATGMAVIPETTVGITANALGILTVNDIKNHKVGVTGSFNNWGRDSNDIPMTDADGDGIYEGVIDIAKVTSDMIEEQTADDVLGNPVQTGKKGITFKVRLDNDWMDQWSEYSPVYGRTSHSNTSCVVEAKEGSHIHITVKLDTTKNHPDAIAAGEIGANDPADYTLIPVTYSVQEVQDTVAATGIKLNKTSVSLEKSKTTTLTATVTPSNATDKKVTWTTSNKKVATVDSTGKITAVGTGTATITAKTSNGKSATCKVTVKISPTSITLNKTSVTIVKGKTATIKATVNPSNATDKKVTWTTSNKKVATVSGGKITAKGAGTATITAKTSNGKTKTCKVTVNTPPTSVKLNKTSLTIGKGKTATLKATVNPTKNVTSKAVTWSTSYKKIVTVKNGKITAKKVGTATITVKTANGKTAKCKVTVKNLPSKVKLNKTKATIESDGTVTLKATVSPSNVTSKKVTWTSSNKKVATVNSKGKVTAKKPGTVTITTKTVNGKTAKCKITVKKIDYVNRLKTYIDKHSNGKMNGNKYIKMTQKLGTYNTTTYIINDKSSKKPKVRFTVSGTNPSNYTKATITTEYYLGNSTVKPNTTADYTYPFKYGFKSSTSLNAKNITTNMYPTWNIKSTYGLTSLNANNKNVIISDSTDTFNVSLTMVSLLTESRAKITMKQLGFTKYNG